VRTVCGRIIPRGPRCPAHRLPPRGRPHRRLRPQVLAEEALCWRCGKPARRGDPLVLGHVIARAQGGPLERWNVHAEHRSCDARAGEGQGVGREPRGARTPREFFARETRVSDTAAASEKRCRRCGEVKPLEGFPPAPRIRDGRNSWCRTCHLRRPGSGALRTASTRRRTTRLDARARSRRAAATVSRCSRRHGGCRCAARAVRRRCGGRGGGSSSPSASPTSGLRS
jgi:hypothetical protein